MRFGKVLATLGEMTPPTTPHTTGWLEALRHAHPDVYLRDHLVSVDDGAVALTLIRTPKHQPGTPPTFVVPGFVAAMSTWSQFLPVLVDRGPVAIAHTREKRRDLLQPRASTSASDTEKDLAAALAALEAPPSLVIGASTGAHLVAYLAANGLLAAGTPLALLMPLDPMTVPKPVPVVAKIPRWAFAVATPPTLAVLHPLAARSEKAPIYRDLLDAVSRGSAKDIAAAAASWHGRPLPTPATFKDNYPTYVLGVRDDPHHPAQISQNVANTLGSQYRIVHGFETAHSSNAAEHICRWADAHSDASAAHS